MKIRAYGTGSILAIAMVLTGCGVSTAEAQTYDNHTRPIIRQEASILGKFRTELKRFIAHQGGEVGVMDFEENITVYESEIGVLETDVEALAVPDDLQSENQLLSQSLQDSYNAFDSFDQYLKTDDISIINGNFKGYTELSASEILQFRQTLDRDEGK